MKTNSTYARIVLLVFLSSSIFKATPLFGQTSAGTAAGVPTFHCIGITWTGSGGSAGTVCNVQYRVASSGSAWKTGYPLSFDSRAVGGRSANEYRGSLVNLTPGTNYEIQVSAGSAINTFTCTTWSETFPVASTTTLSSPTTISTSGTATAYRVYTGAINGGTNNLVINASYIIIRNMTLTAAAQDAILLQQNAHDVIIEGCDISGWGAIGMGADDQAAVRTKGFSYNALGIVRIVVQRNKIHDSRENSNSWDDGGHPLGPNGINFEHAGGNNVFRYNEIYTTDPSKKFMDGIGGADNFTFDGFPNNNSDIYANKVSNVYDDAIEAEGANCNVRIWGNFLDNTFTGVSTATNSVGPSYIFNNVTNVGQRSPYGASNSTLDNEDRGPFNKNGSQDATYRGGRCYLFHNTILQPVQSGFSYPRGLGGGPVDNSGGAATNLVSRNNIWQTHRPNSNWPPIAENSGVSNSGNTYDYDLYNGSIRIVSSGTHESHGIQGSPTYANGVPVAGPNPSGYFLSATSNGVDDGLVLPNFNDGFTGAAPDIGAYEIGKPALQFGVNAYLITGPQPPIANAGANITLTLPVNSTTLTGSGSDADGTIASYGWAWVSGPATYILGSANTASTTLTGLLQGTYVFRLTVTDNSGMTGTDDITITVNAAANQAPTANAGANITLTLPVNSTTLTGSGADADGTIAGYSWARVSGPTTFTLGSANAATTALSNLVAGTYTFRLTVTDNSGATGTDDVVVTVNAAANQAPTANAGNNIVITLPVNSTTLTGSGTDADGTIAGYAWTRVSGPTTFTLGTANAATTALGNLVAGTYTFRLTVTDNSGATATDDVNVTVNAAANQAPTANAGNNIVITLPANSTTLTGSGTDADGTIAGYAWTRVSGPTTFTLGTANAASTGLSNLVQGVYTFRLTVTDNSGATATDDVNVTVNAAANQAPTANAGANITLTLPTNSTTLTGSGTDADGTIAGYAWTRVSGPATYILGSATAATTTLSNLVAGTYTFRLTVTDNSGSTATDDMTVTVNAAPPTNQAPTANAGANITLTLPTNSTTLTGSGTDADGTIAGYAWTKVSGPTTFTFGNANAATTSLSNLVQGVYTFRLTVTDNNGATGTDDMTVTVNAAANQAPIANAGPNITLTLPTNSTTLTGSGTDADGTIASYVWTRVSGPTTFTLGSASAAATSLSNLVQGTYTFRLTVTDNNGATGTDDMTVTVNAAPVTNIGPIANAGNNIVIGLPTSSTTLNGSGSTDADGTIVSYVWTRISGPATFTFANANAATTALSNLVQGVYTFRLTVTDNNGATDSDNMTVTVNAAANQVPAANAGNNIVITLPVNSTTLVGSGSDLDGTIASYTWTRVSGPTTFTLANANAATTALSNLVQGTYTFRLTVTDNGGATGTDDVIVTVNPAIVPNQLPIARAGNDIVMTLPVNYTTLNGNTSTDPDGIIVSYAWSRISGPATYTFTSAGSVATGLNNLVQGVYVFRLTVTDNSGASATDDITVTVNVAIAGGNQAPVARVNSDILLTLPTNSTTLSGTASTDADGTITAYEWTQLSGPSQVVIASRLSATISIGGLEMGEYIFSLKVTDNNGASSTATVKVTVRDKNAAPIFIKLYPNPASAILTIQYSDMATGKVRLSVYDATRRLVKDEMADKTQLIFTEVIDINILKAGAYILQIEFPDGRKAAKQFVKM